MSIAELDKRCVVYWIRRKDHNDMFSQGYIGITSVRLGARFDQHKCAARKGGTRTISNALRKYDDIIITEILVGTVEYCCMIENKLRPIARIGWNLAVGGEKPMLGFNHTEETKLKVSLNNGMRGKPLTEDHKQKLSVALKGKTVSSEVKQTLSELAKERIKTEEGKAQLERAVKAAALSRLNKPSWEIPKADKNTWLMADKIYDLMMENPEIKSSALSKLLGVPSSKLQKIYPKIKNGWNPHLCQDWLNFKHNLEN
jgi:hypothetical protein